MGQDIGGDVNRAVALPLRIFWCKLLGRLVCKAGGGPPDLRGLLALLDIWLNSLLEVGGDLDRCALIPGRLEDGRRGRGQGRRR